MPTSNDLIELDWNGHGATVSVTQSMFNLIREAVKKYSRITVIEDLVINEMLDRQTATRLVVIALRHNENDGIVVEPVKRSRRRS